MPNLLVHETSPYLRQHADNPVHWQAWNETALALARAEDKPILLSIGYSTCHWCHVMARESFENAEVAALMNRLFVNIKVDREERPDLDQIYQNALQLLSGRAGGWPLTMFLMPDGTPFFGGTYFPPRPRHNLPAFTRILEQVAHAYASQRGELERQNASLLAALARPPSRAAGTLDAAVLAQALADIRQGFDPVAGGFSGTPKFPRPPELDFLFWSGDAAARDEVLFTLERMAARGLMDQLGGGFFRYSVDAHWAIPHFEKMLYDNGPLLGLYADAWAATGQPSFARAATGIVDWLAREMTSPEGLFHAALDADSEHEEGRFYVWTPQQLAAHLNDDEFRVARAYWGLEGPPNFEGHAWHLGAERPLTEVAERLGMPHAVAVERLESARGKLLAARADRVRPGLDDKCLTAWNALAIKGLARAARRFDRSDWLDRARRAADALHRLVWRGGRLAASYQGGQARHHGYLDDSALLLDALLELLQAGWREADLAWARDLADALLLHFEDAEEGGFFFTSHDHERLIQRPKSAHDQAMPSGNGIAAQALDRLGRLLDEPRYQAAADRVLRAFQADIAMQPAAYPSLLTALRDRLAPPALVILRGEEVALREWKVAADRVVSPATLLLALPDSLDGAPANLRRPPSGRPLAYCCGRDKCLPEIVHLPDLLPILRGRSDA